MFCPSSRFPGRLIMLALASLTAAGPLTAQDFGLVAGRVTAAENDAALSGATVAIVGSTQYTTTDANGNFVLSRVPAGSVTLRALYLGRQSANQEVSVTAGQTTRVNFSLTQVTLTTVVIEAVRAKGQAEALTRQQYAPNIMSIVASDQMGRFPDASAPEAVQRLPGVAIDRDQGEGRYIKIRGASPANTQVTVNGEQVPSPESGERQIALDAVPIGVLDAIEVSKAITPDMDADAIGGTVNLVTRKAPESRLFSVEAGGGLVPIRDDYTGLGSFALGGRSSDSRLGGIISGSFSRRNFGSDGIEPDYDLGDTRGDDALEELDVRHYTLWRSRLGATGAVDYRLGDGSSLFANVLYSALTDQEQRRRLTHAIEDGEIAYAHKNREETLSTLNVMGGGEHLSRSGLKFDYRLSFTRSQEDTPFDNEVFFLTEDVNFNPSLADPKRPQPGAGAAVNGPYAFDEAANGVTRTKNRDVTGGANLAVPFQFGASGIGTLKLGAKFRDKRKDNQVTELEFELDDDADDITLGTTVGTSFSNGGFNPGTYPIPFTTAPGDILGFTKTFASRLTSGELNLEEETNDYVLTERVFAGFAMAELSFSPRFTLLPGVRFEQTKLETDGFSYDSEHDALTPTSGSNSYANIFPMLHARWSLDDFTNVRAAYTSAIFRPNFFDLVPHRIRDDEDLAIGNPDLDPVTSNNFDLLFERYDRNIGLLSAGVFLKQLSKPIFITVTDNDLGGETEQPINAKDGQILGFELALQRRLTFLPGFWSGLGIYANYTWTDSKATQPNGRETRLAGQAEQVGNLALSYERGRFSGQVSINHTGKAILELGEDVDDDVFIDARTQIDASATLFLTQSSQFFIEALNLTNQPHRTFVLEPNRPRQIEYYEPWFQMGIRWRL